MRSLYSSDLDLSLTCTVSLSAVSACCRTHTLTRTGARLCALFAAGAARVDCTRQGTAAHRRHQLGAADAARAARERGRRGRAAASECRGGHGQRQHRAVAVARALRMVAVGHLSRLPRHQAKDGCGRCSVILSNRRSTLSDGAEAEASYGIKNFGIPLVTYCQCKYYIAAKAKPWQP